MDEQSETFLTIALAVLAVAAWRYTPRLLAGAPFLDPGEVRAKLDSGEFEIVVDVRTPGEYGGKDGHIPGAVNLPFGELATRLKVIGPELEPYKDLPVVVTCANEQRSSHATRSLKRAGFRNLRVLKGGMRAWKRAGLPLERGFPEAAAEPEAPAPAEQQPTPSASQPPA